MKMLKIYIIIGCVFLGAVFAYRLQDNSKDYPDTYNEMPCLSSGGICAVADDCPDGALSKVSGLCPLQQLKGIECCYSIPISEKRCRYRGGECLSKSIRCNQNLVYNDAIDCERDERCCIQVN